MTDDVRLPEVEYITTRQGWEIIHRQARKYHRTGGLEFILGWFRGDYADRDCETDVLRVVILLPWIDIYHRSRSDDPRLIPGDPYHRYQRTEATILWR